MSKGILYDATLCIGCKACEGACAEQHGLPYNDAIAAEAKQSDHKYTVVLTKDDKFMRRLCMNCEDPTCASVCPVGAFRKNALGPVTYDGTKCIGCRYCLLACPFSVPKYEWSKTWPLVRKCDMCVDRVSNGQPTSCAEICPTGATKFGERDDLIAEAKDRIAKGDRKYINHIYGIEEVGGTSVLLLSSVPFETFGYKTEISTEALPRYTYRVLEKLPDVVLLAVVSLGGIWWLRNRKEEVAAAEEHPASHQA
jgi:formate dehydrogenase iron-sulfur subunit